MLARIVGDLKAQAPDHIAVTGDLVNISLAAEYAPARAWLDALGPPQDVTLVPGNHDAYVRGAARGSRSCTGATTCAATAQRERTVSRSCGGADRWR